MDTGSWEPRFMQVVPDKSHGRRQCGPKPCSCGSTNRVPAPHTCAPSVAVLTVCGSLRRGPGKPCAPWRGCGAAFPRHPHGTPQAPAVVFPAGQGEVRVVDRRLVCNHRLWNTDTKGKRDRTGTGTLNLHSLIHAAEIKKPKSSLMLNQLKKPPSSVTVISSFGLNSEPRPTPSTVSVPDRSRDCCL